MNYILQPSMFEKDIQSVIDTDTGEKIGELIKSSDSITAVAMNGATYTTGSEKLAIEYLINYKPVKVKQVTHSKDQYILTGLFN